MTTQTEVPDFVREAVLSLPPLPEAAARILRLARDPDVDFREIVKIISADQTLTARVLRASNSALYGTSREVQTIRQAVVLLGRDAVTQLVLSVSVLNMRAGGDGDGFDRAAFWRHSMAVAVAARGLATRFGVDPERAFIAGLMHDIGKLVLAEHYGQRYAKLFSIARRGARPLHRIERDIFSVDHAIVGQALCEHWKLASPLAQAVTGHHDAEAESLGPLPAAIRSANALVKVANLGASGNRYVMRANRPLAPCRDRELVLQLPHEVAEMETAFRRNESSDDATASTDQPIAQRPRIGVVVSEPGVEDLLVVMLWSMGYRPSSVATEEAASPDEARPFSGLITDQASTLAHVARAAGPLIDYTAWAAEEGDSIAGGFDLESLRAWLQDELPPVDAAA